MQFRSIITFLLLISCPLIMKAQTNLPWDIWRNPKTQNFETIRQEAEKYFATTSHGRGSGYKQWKRWEDFNQSRLDSNENITNWSALAYDEYMKLKREHQRSNRSPTGDWASWGSSSFKVQGGWNPGVGRINVIAFHPTDPNTLFVGAPAGGLWKTTNHGSTWTCLTEDMSSLGVSGIAIHPTLPNTMYILTGDGDGGATKSIGVYKTVDGGVNWFPTGWVWGPTDEVLGFKLAINPSNPNILYVASSKGLWRTDNGGVTWTDESEDTFTYYDIEFKPGTPSTVYATNYWDIRISTDNGLTWNDAGLAETVGFADRYQIGVSAASPNSVYVIAGRYKQIIIPGMPPDTIDGFKGLYYSSNSGTTFQLQNDRPNILGGELNGNSNKNQMPYDLALAVDPANVANVVAGGINTWTSSNSGVNWTIRAYWYWPEVESNPTTLSYNHADVHFLEYNPLNNRLYSGSDGGVYYSTNNGTTWTDMTRDMELSMIYHFSGTDQDADFMLAGTQDNGSNLFTGFDTMTCLGGGDGTDCMIHPTNKNIFWVSAQSGSLRKTINGGLTWIDSLRAPGTGPFVTTYEMMYNWPDTMFTGWKKDSIYRTYNGGDTWIKSKMGNGLNGDVTNISSSKYHNTIYACTYWDVFRSSNFGVSWTKVYTGDNLTNVAVDPYVSTRFWVTHGGYTSDPKVFLVDGTTPTDATINLPPVPVNVIAIVEENPAAKVYVGTDIGVFFLDVLNIFDGWTWMDQDLPNVIVKDLEIYEAQGKIRAATYGRGIYESGLISTCVLDLVLTPANDPFFSFPVYDHYSADNSILSNRQILSQFADVSYKAGDLVMLTDGFLAIEGNKFIAGNASCNINLNFNGQTSETRSAELDEVRRFWLSGNR